MRQAEALDLLKLGYNVFLTGAAGAGKTYVLNSYIRYLREHGVNVAVTASTGIAATHLSGQTVHSWCGMGTRDSISDGELELLVTDRRLRSSVGRAKVLIIDEVSMLHARQLELIERITRAVRGGCEPFGGLQVVLCGDFFQLPPVTNRTEVEKFAFSSRAWQAGRFTVCYLHEQHRQQADPLLAILNDIRSASVGEHTKIPLRTRYKRSPLDANGSPSTPTLLYAKNINVDSVNDAALAKLPGVARTYSMTSKGFRAHVDSLKKNCLAPKELSVKIGAQVMFVKNSTEGAYVNGTRGVVESFDPVDGWPEIRTLEGVLICAEPDEWRFEESGVARASITQVPLRLAWAITIHKSQGMTLDAAEVDLSDAFEPGMGYVALSRLRTLNGLKLMGLNETALRVHPEVLQRDHLLHDESMDAERKLADISIDSRRAAVEETLFKRFCGRRQPPTAEAVRNPRKRGAAKAKAPPTHMVTRDMIASGASVEAVARDRGLSIGTIVQHLEKLQGESENVRFDHLRCALPNEEFEAVLDEVRRSDDGKLKPIWEKFNGRYPFEIIRIVRLFAHG